MGLLWLILELGASSATAQTRGDLPSQPGEGPTTPVMPQHNGVEQAVIEREDSRPPTHLGVRLKGVVLEAGTREPLEDVMVRWGDTDLEAYSDEAGAFELEVPLEAGILKVGSPGYLPSMVPMGLAQVQATNTRPLKVFLTPRASRGPAMVVEARPSMEQMTLHSISIEEARYVPGTFGDPVRAIQNLPGINRSPYALGVLIIRGSFPYESGYFVEGTTFPLLYHFLGLTSSITGDLLERIDYLPGGFGVRYGRLMGGIVNLELQDDFPGNLHGYAEVDLVDSSLYVQGSVGSNFSFAAAARRSYMDFFLEPIIANLSNYQIRAPRYWDAQLRLNYRISRAVRANLTLLSSSDEFAVLGQYATAEAAENSERAPQVQYSTRFNKVLGQLKTRLGPTLTQDLTVSYGPESEYFKYGNTLIEAAPNILSVRSEWRYRPYDPLLLSTGLDLQAIWHRFNVADSGNDDQYDLESFAISPSTYLEAEWQVLPGLRLQPGVRWDPYVAADQDYRAYSVDPRMSVHWTPMPGWEVSGALGQYSQFPLPAEYFSDIGNNQLEVQHSLQLSLGGKHRFRRFYGLELTGYYNQLEALVVSPITDPISIDQFILDPQSLYNQDVIPYTNDGSGRTYGLEFLLRRYPGEKFFGWVAYSLGRSERRQRDDQPFYLFEYDQTHVFTALGAYDLGRGWSVGGRLRYATGNPFTPYENRYQNVDTGGYICVEDPARGANYERLAPYHTLDARVDKNIVFKRWKMAFSFELQNAYNRKNVEIPYYSYDCNELMAIYGQPIFPVLGFRGEF